MKLANKIFITIGIYLGLALVYMLAATYINIDNLYRVALGFNLLLGLLIIFTIIRIGVRKREILFYNNKLGMIILIIVLFSLGGTSIGVSRLYKEKLAGTSHETLSSLTRKPKEVSKSREPYQEYERENIKILYRKEVEPALDLINVYLDEIQKDTEKVFGQVNHQDLTIKLTDEETFRKDLLVDEWTGGYYYEDLKQITIPVEDAYWDILTDASDTTIKSTIRHEYAHYISHMFRIENNINQGSLPAWFEEGVATYFGVEGNDGFIGKPTEIELFSELSSQEEWKRKPSYEQSFQLVYLLTLKNGDDVIKDIILKTKEIPFNEAFKIVSGESIKEYEDKLIGYVENSWKGFPRKEDWTSLREEYKRKERIDGLEEYIKISKENMNAFRELGNLYNRGKNYNEAIRVFKLAINEDEDNFYAWEGLGLSYASIYDLENSIKAYEEALSLEPNEILVAESLANLYVVKNVDKSIEILQSISKFYKDRKELTNSILNEYKLLKKNLEYGDKYSAYLKFLKSDIVSNYPNIDLLIINNILKENPDYKGPAKDELIKMKEDLDARL